MTLHDTCIHTIAPSSRLVQRPTIELLWLCGSYLLISSKEVHFAVDCCHNTCRDVLGFTSQLGIQFAWQLTIREQQPTCLRIPSYSTSTTPDWFPERRTWVCPPRCPSSCMRSKASAGGWQSKDARRYCLDAQWHSLRGDAWQWACG